MLICADSAIRPRIRPKRLLGSLTLAAALAVSPGLTEAASHASAGSRRSANRCILYRQIANWKALGPETIYLRTSTGYYYRLDLAGRCPSITLPGAFLITRINGPALICSAIDWDLHVAQSWHDIPEACLVKKMTEVPKSQIMALPAASRP